MDTLTRELHPGGFPIGEVSARGRRLTPEEAEAYTAEIKRLAPQRLSVALLAERLKLSDNQVFRLARLAGIDTSSPLVVKVTTEHPDVVARMHRKRVRDAELVRLAAEGWTDSQLAARFRLSRNRVASIRGDHGQPATLGKGRRSPKPVVRPSDPGTPAELQRVWDLAIQQHRAGPVMGVCRGCRIFRPLTNGLVPLHYHQPGKPCTGSHQRPLPQREES